MPTFTGPLCDPAAARMHPLRHRLPFAVMTSQPQRRFPYQGSARIVGWDDVQDDDVHGCPCGWEGPLTQLVPEDFQDLIDYSCPQCDRTLVLRKKPTGEGG
jgi:hypothetical protein